MHYNYKISKNLARTQQHNEQNTFTSIKLTNFGFVKAGSTENVENPTKALGPTKNIGKAMKHAYRHNTVS